ncbi:hypothetical protein FOCC_FOCC011765 [Frankliniella occidentalis]|nr:hypothetical protein FOCC_FOCC011765 [Frankliniella occidentalis]
MYMLFLVGTILTYSFRIEPCSKLPSSHINRQAYHTFISSLFKYTYFVFFNFVPWTKLNANLLKSKKCSFIYYSYDILRYLVN